MGVDNECGGELQPQHNLTVALSAMDQRPDPALVAAGWQRRFTADPQRLKEAVALYEELGYEVHLATIVPEAFRDVCQGCVLLACKIYQTIYTRSQGA